MWKQIEHFRDKTQLEVIEQLGEEKGKELFSKAIYYIITGSNDFLNGYYFLIPTSPRGITLNDFIQLLVNTASQQLKVKITTFVTSARQHSLPVRKLAEVSHACVQDFVCVGRS